MPNQPGSNLPPDEPQAEPSVGELLLAEIDATCRRVTLELNRLERLCRQPAPEQAQWTLAVIATMRVGNTEIEDRVHANPLDGGLMTPNTLAIVVALGVYITGLILYALFGAEVEALVRSLL